MPRRELLMPAERAMQACWYSFPSTPSRRRCDYRQMVPNATTRKIKGTRISRNLVTFKEL